MTVVAIVSTSLEHQFFLNFASGLYTSNEQALKSLAANDARQSVVRYALLVIYLVVLVVALIWVYRANERARKLSAVDIKFSPWGAIAWYFVPIANLWKPYFSMKEIWLASSTERPGWGKDHAAVVRWWWFLFLATSIAGIVALGVEFKAENVRELFAENMLDDLLVANKLTNPSIANLCTLIFELFCLPSVLVFVSLVRKISDRQLAAYQMLQTQGRSPNDAEDRSQFAVGRDSAFRGSLNQEWVLSGFDSNGNIVRFLLSDKNEKLMSAGLLLGRDESASDIVIASELVSRRHARVSVSDGDLWVADLNSTNGTFLNNSSLPSGEEARLGNGAKLTLGDIDLAITRAR